MKGVKEENKKRGKDGNKKMIEEIIEENDGSFW